MSIPKSREPLSTPKRGHYFDPVPEAESKPRTLRLRTGDLEVELQADRGVFGSRAIDLGTLTLLKEAPLPPPGGDLLDLGCGYGPIAIALARRSPAAKVWAVDVNERALQLARDNAIAARTPNVVACLPDEVPPDLRFSAIYSNPPVRVGKAPLHELLLRWLPRLAPGASAFLVVQRNLGADSLAKWLAAEGWQVQRIKSKKGYRILEVKAPQPH
ncbi:MAG: rRNA (guanine1207-N2)-methyltransferase [Actinomycetota bacterium]|nr:rRNA (guanine1207-N2)-methyltransferase [Actinomycetota bacterium]